MTTSEVEFRAIVRFLKRKGLTGAEIINELREVYEEECPSKSFVYNWMREFGSGRTSVFDEKCGGRPIEIGDTKEQEVSTIIRNNRRITIRELSTRVNVSLDSCHRILKSLGVRKLSSRFVPRFLTREMMDRRLDCCEAFSNLLQEHGDDFKFNILTEDETALNLYLPESRRESKEWKFPDEKPTKMLRSGQSHGRCFMLTLFWDSKGVVLMDFADRDVKINAEYYIKLLEQVRRTRRKPRNLPYWILHDNAPIHSAGRTKCSMQELGFETLMHPPYSPDLAPSDFFLFRHLKKHLRGQRFQTKDALRHSVEEYFEGLPLDHFRTAFDELVIRVQKCIDCGGGYIEK